MSSSDKLLLQGLKELTWKVYELEQSVENYKPEQQDVIDERLLNFTEALHGLRQHTAAFSGVNIPQEMLERMDQGENPHDYIREVLKASKRDNQAAKGKVVAIQNLYDAVLGELKVSMPQHATEYERLVTEHVAELKKKQTS